MNQDASLERVNAALCQQIRDGKIDYKDHYLIEHLRKTTMDKLSINNPGYSAYKRALEEN